MWVWIQLQPEYTDCKSEVLTKTGIHVGMQSIHRSGLEVLKLLLIGVSIEIEQNELNNSYDHRG